MIESGEDRHGPYAVLTCDKCQGHQALRPAGGPPEPLEDAAVAFGIADGWIVTVDGDLCPACWSALAGQGRSQSGAERGPLTRGDRSAR